MQTKKRLILKSTVAVALIALGTLWGVNRAGAFTLKNYSKLFPNVGITRGQTARINVSNLSDKELNFTLEALDNEGVFLLPAVRMTIAPSQTRYVDLNADLIGPEGRLQVRAAVDYFLSDPSAVKAIVGSLEVFDNDTGKTQVLVIPTDQ